MNDWRDDFDEKMWDTEVEIEREDRLRSNKGWRVAGHPVAAHLRHTIALLDMPGQRLTEPTGRS